MQIEMEEKIGAPYRAAIQAQKAEQGAGFARLAAVADE